MTPPADETSGSIPISDSERRYLMAERQACIIRLGALEDYLQMERSIVPRRKREPVELRDKFERLTGERR